MVHYRDSGIATASLERIHEIAPEAGPDLLGERAEQVPEGARFEERDDVLSGPIPTFAPDDVKLPEG